MKAFISYSHNDSDSLEVLHKHLAQLIRQDLISEWHDGVILAGEKLDDKISSSLKDSNLFIALLSPDYISSPYCYNKEFEEAIKLVDEGKMIIVPIILEPCDWLNTPLSEFKALPKDGKPISTWENKNIAFLDVVQNLRKLIEAFNNKKLGQLGTEMNSEKLSKNYRVTRDFDSIDKLEYVEESYKEIKEYLVKSLVEVKSLDGIKSRIVENNNDILEFILVNRNKIDTEAQVIFNINSGNQFIHNDFKKGLSYKITSKILSEDIYFSLSFDDYDLFWRETSFFNNKNDKLSISDIADLIWNKTLESIGVFS